MGIVKRIEYYVKCDRCGKIAGTGVTPEEAVERAFDAGFLVYHWEEAPPQRGKSAKSSGRRVMWVCANCPPREHTEPIGGGKR